MSKKKSKIDLEHGLFSRIVKIKQKIIGESDTASKNKNKYIYQYLNLKVSQHDQKIIVLLKTTGLKLISRQKKSISTTGYFNDTFLVNTTPMEIYFKT